MKNAPKSILSIDPGFTESAWLLWSNNAIHTFGKAPNGEVLDIIRNHTSKSGLVLAIERLACYGMAVGEEVLETAVWTGRFIEAWQSRSAVEIIRPTRQKTKMNLCHSPKAKDANVRQAIIDRLGAPGTKKKQGATYGVTADVWAALAVGLYVVDNYSQLKEAA